MARGLVLIHQREFSRTFRILPTLRIGSMTTTLGYRASRRVIPWRSFSLRRDHFRLSLLVLVSAPTILASAVSPPMAAAIRHLLLMASLDSVRLRRSTFSMPLFLDRDLSRNASPRSTA